VVHAQSDYQDGLFLQRGKRGLPQGVGITRKAAEAFLEGEGRVRVEEMDTILYRQAKLRKVTPAQATNQAAAAEGVGELLL
jgi:hypothetical protein